MIDSLKHDSRHFFIVVAPLLGVAQNARIALKYEGLDVLFLEYPLLCDGDQ